MRQRGCHLLCLGVVFSPSGDEFVQVMRTEDGPITSEVVKVIHNDGYEEVNELKKSCIDLIQ